MYFVLLYQIYKTEVLFSLTIINNTFSTLFDKKINKEIEE